jgi:hypothetical protein
MSQITDVLVSFDTTEILRLCKNPSKDPNRPTQISPNQVFMITTQNNVISGQAGGELDLKAQVGDLIRWRETTLSLGFENSAIFYQFVATGGNDLISTPTPREAEVTVPVPNPKDPVHPKNQHISNYFWSSETLKTGRVVYHFNFMICDRNGAVAGYFWWDPFITIHN